MTALVVGLGALLPAPALAVEPSWQLEHPPPPPGAPVKVPLGRPGDLQFYGSNRGLLAVEGNAAIPRGIFTYDGAEWRQLATVCGGPGDTARIAFAGPREFWTVSEPSRPRFGSGTALCHFRDGQVVASYSTPEHSPDPYRPMASASCTGPTDCWFGGFGAQDATGERVGAFHLHWNGTALETHYGPQGRGVSDLEAFAGTVFESTYVGARPGDTTSDVVLAEPELDPADPARPKPRLVHRIAGGRFLNDPFTVADPSGVPPDGSELLALDGDASQLWAVGGGAASGPSAPAGGSVARPPLALRLELGSWREIVLADGAFNEADRFVDVAAVPGTDSAWMAVATVGEARSVNARGRVAKIAADGSASTELLPVGSWGRGSAAKIAFTASNDGWLVTQAGWLFHYTDGSRPPRDADPAYAGTITFRPNEAAEQFVPDSSPVDDSELFRPPPLELEQPPAPAALKRLPPLLRGVRTQRRGLSLIVRFRLVRPARVALIARRKGKVVARTRAKLLQPGRHTLRLRLNRRRWPQRLTFSVREPGAGGEPVDDGDTVTTGAASARMRSSSGEAPR